MAFGGVASALVLVPVLYLTTLALLLSAYAHGYGFPSRSFLKAYAAPSNGLVQAPESAACAATIFRFASELLEPIMKGISLTNAQQTCSGPGRDSVSVDSRTLSARPA